MAKIPSLKKFADAVDVASSVDSKALSAIVNDTPGEDVSEAINAGIDAVANLFSSQRLKEEACVPVSRSAELPGLPEFVVKVDVVPEPEHQPASISAYTPPVEEVPAYREEQPIAEEPSRAAEEIKMAQQEEYRFAAQVPINLARARMAMEEFSVDIPRADMAQKLVDMIFDKFKLMSINASYFGELVANYTPYGYSVQEVCGHIFFVKESDLKIYSSMIPLMDKIRLQLAAKPVAEFPVVYRRNLEGSVMYALNITAHEIEDVRKTFPDLEFGYYNSAEGIDGLRLRVKEVR